jgi:hypothetical protein
MTIPSTISGGPSIFQLHLGSGEVLDAVDESDVLVAFYQQSYDAHLSILREGGICFYDSGEVPELKHERGIHHIGIPFTAATVEAIGGSARDRGKTFLCWVFYAPSSSLLRKRSLAFRAVSLTKGRRRSSKCVSSIR